MNIKFFYLKVLFLMFCFTPILIKTRKKGMSMFQQKKFEKKMYFKNQIFHFMMLHQDTINLLPIKQKQVRQYLNHTNINIISDLVNQEYKILLLRYSDAKGNFSSGLKKSDTISVLTEKISVADIFQNEYVFNQKIKLGDFQIQFNALYKLIIKNQIFIVMAFNQYGVSQRQPVIHFLALFDVTNPEQVKYNGLSTFSIWNGYLPYDKFATIRVLGDFNSNGKLDFAPWNPLSESENVSCYELNEDNRFILLPDFYVKTKIGDEGSYYIDTDNSRWFFNIKKGKFY